MNLSDFKHIQNIEGEKATMLVYDRIGDGFDSNNNYIPGISGSRFADELNYLSKLNEVKSIDVRINSIGGSVFEGYSIMSAIMNCKKPVNTFVDGLAASIAGVIAVSGKKCYMADYGLLMLHNPSGGDDKVLDAVKETLLTVISNRCQKSKDEISLMMDVETWMTAEEALKAGMIDEIVTSKKKFKVSKTENLADLMNIYNNILTKPKMEKVTNLLKLQNNATEAEVVKAIETKDSEIEAVKKENEELKNKVAEFEKKETEAKEAAIKEADKKATELVENAVKEKKISETEKEQYKKLALVDFASVENMLNKITNNKDAVKIFDIKNIKKSEGREDWTIRDWEKKDPKGLEKIQNETPEIYNHMYNSYYNKK
jgi:ATP-dependent protease ClpP protease subunit